MIPGTIFSPVTKIDPFVEFIMSTIRTTLSYPRAEINAMVEFYGEGCILTKSIAPVHWFHILNVASESGSERVR